MPAEAPKAGPTGLVELRAAIEAGEPAKPWRCVAIVGGGGKTSCLFALARSYAEDGKRVLATTTTNILDPDLGSAREGRGFGRILEAGETSTPESLEAILSAGPRVVLGSRRSERKLRGIGPETLSALALLFDISLVEADGSRGLPIKAPAAHEPVIPAAATVVVGVIGLDALGAPMDGSLIHRPELFGPLVGCAPGEPIAAVHLARLAASPLGLFKAAPTGARRVLLLNKADMVEHGLAEDCAAMLADSGAADAIVIGSIGLERLGGVS